MIAETLKTKSVIGRGSGHQGIVYIPADLLKDRVPLNLKKLF
jgi:hypothetical protein